MANESVSSDRVNILTHHSTNMSLDWREVALSDCKPFGEAGPVTEPLYFGTLTSAEVYCTADGCWFFLDPTRRQGGFLSLDQAAAMFTNAGRAIPYELGGTPTTTTTTTPAPSSSAVISRTHANSVLFGEDGVPASSKLVSILDEIIAQFEDRRQLLASGDFVSDGWAGTSSFSLPWELLDLFRRACDSAAVKPHPLNWVRTHDSEIPESVNSYWSEHLRLYDPVTEKGTWYGLILRRRDDPHVQFVESHRPGVDQLRRICEDAILKLRGWRRRLEQKETHSNKSSQEMRIVVANEVNDGLYGRVYRGTQLPLNRPVAVKIIRPEWPNSAGALDHARALIRAGNHPAIVTVYGVEDVFIPQLEMTLPAVIMEWIEGESIGDRLKGPQFSVEEASHVCTVILDGVGHLHSHGVAHGDLHLGNVIVLPSGSPKIIDIDANKDFSLGHLSTISREGAISSDIDYCRVLAYRVVSHSVLRPSVVTRIDLALAKATSLQELRDVVSDQFQGVAESDSSVRSSTPDPLAKLCAYGLERTDAIVLKAVSEEVLTGSHILQVIMVSQLISSLKAEGLNDEDVLDSIEHLSNRSFITATGGRFSRYVLISGDGFDAYLQCFYSEYDLHFSEVKAAIVKGELITDEAGQLMLPRPLLSHFFNILESRGLCDLSRTNVGARITNISVELRRQVATR